MSHFANSVKIEISDKLLNLAQAVKEDFISEQSRETYGDATINEISGKSFDGFMAFQNGGYEISELIRSDIDSSYHLTSGQSNEMNRLEKQFYNDFKNDHPELNLSDDYGYDDIPEELQNEFSEMENDYFEPALLRFETWESRDNDNEIFMRLSLNYMDAPYYRSKRDETLFVITISPAQLLKKDVSFFLKLFNRKMRNVK